MPQKNDELTTTHSAALQMIDVAELTRRQRAIVQAMKNTMQLGTHFGVPYRGSTKNVLLKPGAELLGVLFQLAPSYKVSEVDHAGDHREYRICCELHYIPTQAFIAQGLGSCSTKEKKYRYRNLDEFTGVNAPYEANRKRQESFPAYQEYLREVLKKAGADVPADSTLGHGKNDDTGQYEISIKARGENPDLADEYNTVLKMAKKRAHIDAILNATGASELFTQDVDDYPDYNPNAGAPNNDDDSDKDRGRNSNAKAPNHGESRTNTSRPAGPPQPHSHPAHRDDEPEERYGGVETPEHLRTSKARAKAWHLTGELPSVRQAQLRSTLKDPAVTDQKVMQIGLMSKMYLEAVEYIGLISDGISHEDAAEWMKQLKQVQTLKELRNVHEAVKLEVENA